MKTTKLKTKDIITITLLSLINVVIFFSSAFLYITPVSVLLMPVFLALLNGIVFFILGTKIKKRGAIFIYCAILGILGTYPPFVIAYLATGIIAEIILAKTGYGNANGLLVSYVIIQLAASFGSTIYPYMVAFETLLAQAQASSEDAGYRESVIESAEMLASGGAIFVVFGVIVAAVVGGLIGKRIVKKHISSKQNLTDENEVISTIGEDINE